MAVKKNKKTGLWNVRVSYKDENDKFRTKSKAGFKTKKEAEVYEGKLKQKVMNGYSFVDDDITVAEYFETWCETYKMKDVSPSTINRYKLNVKLAKKFFKKRRLKDLTRIEYQAFLDKRGKNCGQDALEKTHFAFKKCMEDALHDGIITKDPTWRAQLNFKEPASTRIKYWNQDELNDLIDYFSKIETPADMIFYLLATTGMRIGEAYGLSWKDIDDNLIHINRGYNHSYKIFTEGKTKASIRTIQIDQQTKALLNRYKLAYRKQCPKYLFLNHFEDPIITHAGAVKYLKKVCGELDVEVLTPHAFRHSHCSYLIFNHIDINYIANRLGHSSVIETQKTYSHVIKELKAKEETKTIDAIDRLTKRAK